MHRQGFARHRGLVDRGVAGGDDAVDRNHGARADDDDVILREFGELLLREGALRAAHPDLLDLDGELVGERGKGLFPRVALEHVAQAKQEREQAHRAEVEADERDEDRRGVEHRDVELAAEDVLHALDEVRDRVDHGVADVDDHREEGPQEDVAREAREVELGVIDDGRLARLAGERGLAEGLARAGGRRGRAREREERRERALEEGADAREEPQDRHVREAALDRAHRVRDDALRKMLMGAGEVDRRKATLLGRIPGDDRGALGAVREGAPLKRAEVLGRADLRRSVRDREGDAAREGIHHKSGDARDAADLLGEDDGARVGEHHAGLPALAVADGMLQIKLHSQCPGECGPRDVRRRRSGPFLSKTIVVISFRSSGSERKVIRILHASAPPMQRGEERGRCESARKGEGAKREGLQRKRPI